MFCFAFPPSNYAQFVSFFFVTIPPMCFYMPTLLLQNYFCLSTFDILIFVLVHITTFAALLIELLYWVCNFSLSLFCFVLFCFFSIESRNCHVPNSPFQFEKHKPNEPILTHFCFVFTFITKGKHFFCEGNMKQSVVCCTAQGQEKEGAQRTTQIKVFKNGNS